MALDIKGCGTALVTPFAKDGTLDVEALRRLVQFQLSEGIDFLVQLSGGIDKPQNWEDLTQESWDKDFAVNLLGPFFAAQEAIKHMKQSGGKIILTSTASASHGGGKTSLAYGVAKSGIECLTKGLAKDCAQYKILVNALAPGFIMSKAHIESFKRTPEDLAKRAQMVPLKRAGTPQDVASMVMYLLSPHGNFVTGQILAISGGDFI